VDILRKEFNMNEYSPFAMNFYDQVSRAIFPTYSSKKKDRVFFFYSLVFEELLRGLLSHSSG
jgi:hypothetical protein